MAVPNNVLTGHQIDLIEGILAEIIGCCRKELPKLEAKI